MRVRFIAVANRSTGKVSTSRAALREPRIASAGPSLPRKSSLRQPPREAPTADRLSAADDAPLPNGSRIREAAKTRLPSSATRLRWRLRNPSRFPAERRSDACRTLTLRRSHLSRPPRGLSVELYVPSGTLRHPEA